MIPSAGSAAMVSGSCCGNPFNAYTSLRYHISSLYVLFRALLWLHHPEHTAFHQFGALPESSGVFNMTLSLQTFIEYNSHCWMQIAQKESQTHLV